MKCPFRVATFQVVSIQGYILPGYVHSQVMFLPGCVSYSLCPLKVMSFQFVSFRVVSLPGFVHSVLCPIPRCVLLLGL